ncbi:hypothetical protein OOZ15_08875 [Galbibacter sp. EGI 63066]|uniref:hypothetical protein n=1 Tax=Galbibacter sp. EGI 63066 TaxID=2993559 RepID=UPI0022487B99|nr:hypothetical protein [Galbibacter sp. EGI 63066]MCX2680048.1 hypothetical protein [Galbibacter sp. EGI 63066]
MNNKSLKRKVNFLTFYVLVSNLILITFIFMGFRDSEKKENLDELTIKRLNIVDESGKNLRMVISNKTRQHPGMMNGKEFQERERPSGIIFFNSSGDECGGLIYDGNEKDAGMVLSVDKFKDDQIMQLQYMENTKNHKRKYGLQIWDFPKENTYTARMNRFKEIENLKTDSEKKQAYHKMELDSLLMEDRLFIGKNFNKNVGLFINDKKGRPRIKIYIDENDTPKIELLNKEGEIIK